MNRIKNYFKRLVIGWIVEDWKHNGKVRQIILAEMQLDAGPVIERLRDDHPLRDAHRAFTWPLNPEGNKTIKSEIEKGR